MPEVEDALRAKEEHARDLLTRRNVVGVGVGEKTSRGRKTGEVSVVVLVRQKLPVQELPPQAVVPKQVDGVQTDVLAVGTIRAQQLRTDRWRPAPGGVSIGHYRITAGTLGCVVRDRASGERLILSNNHVLANSNNASPGDPILQPGAADGGQLDADLIGYLERFVPIVFTTAPPTCDIATNFAKLVNELARLLGSSHRVEAYRVDPQAVNLVDAALARPVSDDMILDEILEIGAVTGVAPAALGMPLRKSGRTTGFTTGEVIVLDTTVEVSYGLAGTARFENQIVTTPMSQGGDSGSLVVAGEAPLAVGLLFAGSDQSTVISPIQLVLDGLNVDIGAASQAAPAPAAAPSERPAEIYSAPAPKSTPNGEPGTRAQRAQEIRRQYEGDLMRRANVVGVGVGYMKRGGQRTGEVGLVVMVDRKLPLEELAPQDVIPRQIEGVPVDVQEVGRLRAQ